MHQINATLTVDAGHVEKMEVFYREIRKTERLKLRRSLTLKLQKTYLY